ncbi:MULTISPECIES: DUF6056 family protein [Campylobacter]|uniref:DUF6056 family protein n=1 Tax=Campylobacter TaxID=194 RepID=UPI000A33D1BE|nr:DUF6056 family protein [Campylobacter sp. P0024]MCR8679769.1 DUF6056 family protein [Campylobacter sp. RM19072]
MNLKIKYLNLSIFGVLFAILLFLNLLYPAQADDYTLYQSALNGNFLSTYFEWNGRIGEILFSGYFAKFAFSPIFDIINAIIGTAFLFLGFLLCFGRVIRDKADIVLLALWFAILGLFGYFGSIFLWGAGSVNYLWGVTLIFIFCLPYRLFWDQIYNHTQKSSHSVFVNFIWLGFGFLAFLAGMASEFIGVMIIFATTISFIYAKYHKTSLPFWQIWGFFGFVVGWITLFLSPGSNKRAEIANFMSLGEFFDLSFLDKIITINQALDHNYSDIFVIFLISFSIFYIFKNQIKFKSYRWIIAILLTGVAAIFAKHICAALVFAILLLMMRNLAIKDKFYYIFIALFLLWIFMGVVLFGLIEGVPKRTSVVRDIVLMAIIILIFKELYNEYSKIISLISFSLFICSVIFVSYHSYKTYLSQKAINQEIIAQKIAGKSDIVIPKKLIYKSKKFIDFGNLQEDLNHWINQAVANHHNIQSISIK